jgi:hypothetical protein
MKKIYYIPAEYKVSVLYQVVAESVEEAKKLAKDSECISVDGPNYVEGSLEIIEEEFVAKNLMMSMWNQLEGFNMKKFIIVMYITSTLVSISTLAFVGWVVYKILVHFGIIG